MNRDRLETARASPDPPIRETNRAIQTLAESIVMNNTIYRAAFENHHVVHVEEFDSFEGAAKFLHGWSRDIHTWPVGIHEPRGNRLWLWCGYRTMGVSSDSALADARGVLGLPENHAFTSVDMMTEDI